MRMLLLLATARRPSRIVGASEEPFHGLASEWSSFRACAIYTHTHQIPTNSAFTCVTTCENFAMSIPRHCRHHMGPTRVRSSGTIVNELNAATTERRLEVRNRQRQRWTSTLQHTENCPSPRRVLWLYGYNIYSMRLNISDAFTCRIHACKMPCGSNAEIAAFKTLAIYISHSRKVFNFAENLPFSPAHINIMRACMPLYKYVADVTRCSTLPYNPLPSSLLPINALNYYCSTSCIDASIPEQLFILISTWP